MAGVLRVCWNIFPIFFALASLTFTILVLISGTNANNDLANIYFMRVFFPDPFSIALTLRSTQQILFPIQFLTQGFSTRSPNLSVSMTFTKIRSGVTAKVTTQTTRTSHTVQLRRPCTSSTQSTSSKTNSSKAKTSLSLNPYKITSVV